MYNGCYTNERETMQTERLHKDIQDIMKVNEDLFTLHSGGGCEHLAYKGWLINEGVIEDGIVVDFDYDITKIKLNTILSFGDYDHDTDKNYTFQATILEGIELIDRYEMKGTNN